MVTSFYLTCFIANIHVLALLISKLISTLLVLLTESSNGLNAANSCHYDSSLGMFILFSHHAHMVVCTFVCTVDIDFSLLCGN